MKLTYDDLNIPEPVIENHDDWLELYRLAWKLAVANYEYPAEEGWLPYMTCVPGLGIIWQWDSCFMTFISRYSDGGISAMNNLDNLYRLQRKDGYISMAYIRSTGSPAYGERINPPLFAWAEWEYYKLTGDKSRFERILPVLTAYYRWVKENRRRPNGLYWFEDCGSSGMDNSPRAGYQAYDLKGSDVCFIDLACQQALAAKCISSIASAMGKLEISTEFKTEHESLIALINQEHWCERYSFYLDLFSRDKPWKKHKYLSCKTAAAFWAMAAGVSDPEKTAGLVTHLLDPNEFNTYHPVPSLSADDPNYMNDGGYWLGGVWAPINYMVAKGLERCGYRRQARDIAVRHLDSMTNTMKTEGLPHTIWECYAPEADAPSVFEEGGLVRPDFVGWSGLGPVSLLIETILGFEFDAQNNTITWHVSLKGRHGIKNLRFNNRKLSLIINEEYDEVTVTATEDILLVISMDNGSKSVLSIKKGEGTYGLGSVTGR